MAETIHRRSNNDLQWQETKRKVKERDHGLCRLCQVLTPGEYKESWNNCEAKNLFQPTDCAHVDAVSIAPSEIYNTENIFFLCRRHHSSIDNLIDPITNCHMSQHKRWYYWWRIKVGSTDEYDESIDYESRYRSGFVEKKQTINNKYRSLDEILDY